MKKNKKELTFKEKIKRLEEIAELLESDDIDLEESLVLFEEGTELSAECMKLLKQAELKVTELKKKSYSNT